MPRAVRNFWQRMTDGVAMQQLWAQFRGDVRAGYEFYARDIAAERLAGESGPGRVWRIAKALFWAMMMKLTPARRVLLLIALVLLVANFDVGNEEFQMHAGSRFIGGLLLTLLLALELSDRVAMKRDLEIAREIQASLMPAEPPRVPGVDIGFASRPANTVAGDYYDAFFRPNGRLLIVVADVAGKSVPAALLTATLQASLRTLAALPGELPELVARVNAYCSERSMNGRRFTTAFVAELDTANGNFTYVNAGHNWPVLKRATGAMERLQAGGLPLGIRAGAEYESGATALGRGDFLLVFTDGLVEAEDERGREYGEERMLAMLYAVGNAGAREALKRVMASVEAFVGGTRQHDDITCMAVRMT